jgi:hypothetical protein
MLEQGIHYETLIYHFKHWFYERCWACPRNVSYCIFEYKCKPVQKHAKNELVLNVSKLIANLVIKADRKINDNKKNLEKEMCCMKNLFDAASSLTALANTFDKKVQYRNLIEMHQELFETIQQHKTPIKGSHQTHTDD